MNHLCMMCNIITQCINHDHQLQFQINYNTQFLQFDFNNFNNNQQQPTPFQPSCCFAAFFFQSK